MALQIAARFLAAIALKSLSWACASLVGMARAAQKRADIYSSQLFDLSSNHWHAKRTEEKERAGYPGHHTGRVDI